MDPANGCEARLDAVTNCGTCGTVCRGATNATPSCSRGACGLTCTAGFGDCDGNATNGCEASTLSNVMNCGACGVACVAGPNAAVACVGGRCRSACNGGFADCDGNPGNGCEVNVATDRRNCGSCGNACASLVCSGGACVAPRSCAELRRESPTTPSGTFSLDPDGAGAEPAFTTYCDMATDGGGWTEIFLADVGGYNTTTLDYQVTSRTRRNDATQVLVAFRQSDRALLPNWVRFTLPPNWRAQAPFRYPQVDETIGVAVNGAASVVTTIRYGYNNWPTLCTDPWIGVDSRYGRICFTGTVAPYYNGFGVGSNLCPDSSQSYSAVACNTSRRYWIGVR